MCSVDPDDFEDLELDSNVCNNFENKDLCRKCHTENATVILRKKDKYCRSCFLSNVRHKFHSTLGKSKQIKEGDKVLVAFSGGTSSMCMLSFLSDWLHEKSHKQMRFKPCFIHLDESCLDTGNESVPHDVCRIAEKYSFECFSIPLEYCIQLQSVGKHMFTSNVYDHSLRDTSLQMTLRKICNRMRASGFFDDFYHLKQKLLVRCASVLGYSKLFVGDNATALSVRLLTDVVQGRGSQISSHLQFACHQDGVQIFRPMREIFLEEIQHWARLQQLNTCTYEIGLMDGANIGSCTKEFLTSLQESFPATVPTVFRTGNKLACSVSLSEKRCSICRGHIDAQKKGATAIDSVHFCQKTSSPVNEYREAVADPSVCYGCRAYSAELDEACLKVNLTEN